MQRTSFALLALAALGLVTSQALAADMARPVYKAPPPPPAPIYNWTGCYIGVNLGGAWGNVDVTDVNTGATISPSNSGFAGGGQIGCDRQMGAWVIGIRNLIDGTSISNSQTFSDPLFSGTVNSHLHWFDMLTARGGYLLQPNLLFYAQGGAAWTSWSVNVLNAAGAQVAEVSGNNRTGWTVGGGVEWMFVPHWSVFLEYNYMNFGTSTGNFAINGFTPQGLPVTTPVSVSAKANLQNVLLGVNYKF